MRATAKGNAKWRALSDTHTKDGRPVAPEAECCTRAGADAVLPVDTPIITTPLRRWLGEFLPDVAAGRLDLDELLAVVDADLQTTPMVCPECAYGRVRAGSGVAYRRGVCVACYMNKLRAAHEETLRELEAKREVDAIKSEVTRARDRLDPDRPRSHAPFRVCDVCGDRLPPAREWGKRTCKACLDLEARHQRPARVAMVRPQDDYGRGGYTVFDTDHAAIGARMLTCSCGYTRPATATDDQDRCPDCLERDQRRGQKVS